jgi:acyl carrier protein
MREEQHAIIARLSRVFQEQFDDEELEIFEDMTASDILQWDSLMHIVLVVAIEKEFSIRLKASEVEELENVGEMIRLIEKMQKPC